MKVFTFGLATTMLSVACNASLFEDYENNDLQEEWDDLDGDRELQAMADDAVDEGGDFTGDEPSPSDSDSDDRRGGSRRKRRNKWRKNKRNNWRRKGGKRGRKGRRGRKNKGPFDADNWEEMQKKRSDRMAKRLQKMTERGTDKCQKVPEKIEEKFCKTWAKIDQEGYDDKKCKMHAEAKGETCKVNIECKANKKGNIFNCNSQFKRMMMSFRKSEIKVGDLSVSQVGDCYEKALAYGKDCASKAKATYEDTMADYGTISKETIQKVMEAMKAEKKEKRERRRNKRAERRRRNNRRGRRNNRRNSSDEDQDFP